MSDPTPDPGGRKEVPDVPLAHEKMLARALSNAALAERLDLCRQRPTTVPAFERRAYLEEAATRLRHPHIRDAEGDGEVGG